MPAHLFYRALRIDFDTGVRANTGRQNCSICPRHWYMDATFACERCGAEFSFSAREQRAWYEDYGFWVDSLPRHCLVCRQALRALKTARREYDESVAHVLHQGDLESKRRLAEAIDRLYELGGELPPRINENRRRLAIQIAREEGGPGRTSVR